MYDLAVNTPDFLKSVIHRWVTPTATTSRFAHIHISLAGHPQTYRETSNSRFLYNVRYNLNFPGDAGWHCVRNPPPFMHVQRSSRFLTQPPRRGDPTGNSMDSGPVPLLPPVQSAQSFTGHLRVHQGGNLCPAPRRTRPNARLMQSDTVCRPGLVSSAQR